MLERPEDVLRLFDAWQGERYVGEQVTQLQHALQAADMAARAEAEDELVLAALLHDVGHLMLLPNVEDWSESQRRHTVLAASALDGKLPRAVVEPIELHVEAKRYLCAKQPGYRDQLSDASIASLVCQGGEMSEVEAKTFRSHPHWRAALSLRLWDDRAKDTHAKPPALATYVPLLSKHWCQAVGEK